MMLVVLVVLILSLLLKNTSKFAEIHNIATP